MSTPASPVSVLSAPDSVHAAFLALLPRIELHARIFFRHITCADTKAEKVAEAVALAYQWFVRLTQRGKDASQFPSVLARYAASAVKHGRRLCGQDKAGDVLSPRAQQQHGFRVERLPAANATPLEILYGSPLGQRKWDEFEERLADNTITPPPDQAQFRIDFAAWLQTLTARERRLIKAMARNERTKDLSRQVELSPGRISQLRREFARGWKCFIGDEVECDAVRA
jgi:hypothetical protein